MTTESRNYPISTNGFSSFPAAGSTAEKAAFSKIQEKLHLPI
jgi:hypothetical protein